MYLNQLLKQDIPLKDALTLIEEKRNEKAIEYLKSQLEEGEALEVAFHQVCPKKLWVHLEGFLSLLSFSKSLQLAICLTQMEQQKKKAMEKKLTYPFLLVLLVSIGSFAFSYFILPTMTRVIDSFAIEHQSLKEVERSLRISWIMMGFLSFGLIGLVTFLKIKKVQIVLYRVLSKVYPRSYFVQKGSIEFVEYYLECLKLQQSSQESFRLLSRIQEKPMVRYIAGEFNRLLCLGISFQAIYSHRIVEPNLQRFFQLSYFFKDTILLLERYLVIASDKQNQRLKRFSMILQCFAYGQIAYLLVLMYQVILYPMRFLQQF